MSPSSRAALKPYLALFSAYTRTLLQYRAAAAAGITTNIVFGFIQIMVFAAFYRASQGPHPMTYQEVVVYIWLGQAMIHLFPWNVDPDIRDQIRNGNVVHELLRPTDLYSFWLCRILARSLVPLLMRGLPIFCIASLFLGLKPPPHGLALLAWVVATLIALFLSAAITALLCISLIWTLSSEGIIFLTIGAAAFFSGMYVPLPLFPEWAQPLLNALPFRGLVDIPLRLYMGHITPTEGIPLLAYQVVWTAGLILLGRILLARGRRHLIVQGG
jgi:ABC-2 type transport system permease protein